MAKIVNENEAKYKWTAICQISKLLKSAQGTGQYQNDKKNYYYVDKIPFNTLVLINQERFCASDETLSKVLSHVISKIG